MLAIATVAMASVATASRAELKSITIGTNPAGTTYNVLGGLFAKTFQEKLGIRSTAQPHSGSSVYLPLIDKGEITVGLNSSLDTGLAYNGRDPYNTATKNVRSLARIWQLPYGVVTKAKDGYKSVEDLRGKRVVVTYKSNVSLAALNKVILATGGLGPSDYTDVPAGNIPQALNLITEGRADAAFAALGIPLLHKAHAGIPGGVRIVSLGVKGTDAFMADGLTGAGALLVQPSKRNVGVEGPTNVAVFDTFVNISVNTSAEDAYKLVKTLHENWAALGGQHPVLKGLKPTQLAPVSNAAPYHPGAIKFFKEAGVWSAANDAREAKFK